MRTIINIILIAGLSYLVHFFVPIWWLFALVAFIISFAFGKNGFSAFFAGFLAIFLLWIGITLYGSFENDFILVNKMSNLIGTPHSSLLFLISALVGGIVGGFSSLTGYFMKTLND